MDSFFGIGLPELILILAIAGVVMGPERIVHIARWLGKTTAQFQSISQAFVRQLHNEIDGIDDGEALKEALSEMHLLRKELENLKSDFISSTNVTNMTKKGTVEEASNSILPPTTADALATSSTNNNGTHTAVSTTTPAQLPTPLDIESDPE